ncbi:hypothetical protein M0802_001191 [Mischocyttarus mexicanus]|nr:hypothetical protein M0802_001191 [Mischocyttarus mexicanus]
MQLWRMQLEDATERCATGGIPRVGILAGQSTAKVGKLVDRWVQTGERVKCSQPRKQASKQADRQVSKCFGWFTPALQQILEQFLNLIDFMGLHGFLASVSARRLLDNEQSDEQASNQATGKPAGRLQQKQQQKQQQQQQQQQPVERRARERRGSLIGGDSSSDWPNEYAKRRLFVRFSFVRWLFSYGGGRMHFEEKCKNKNWTTIYLRAEGTNDTIHYVWDFGGKPSILMALTSLPATLNITCEDFIRRKNNSIVFSDNPIYTIGIIINKIIEFNDVNNTAVINFANATNINVLKPESFAWSRKSFSLNDEYFGLIMESNIYNDTVMNITRRGNITASLKGYYFLEHTDIIPHMLHTENSMLVDLIFDNIETNKTFANSRFAVELMIVGGGNPDKLMIIDPKKNLDDEHTPGIFEVIEVRTPAFNRSNETKENCAYLQWRPISYGTSDRSVSSSTEIVNYPPSKINDHVAAIKNTMLYCYYGEDVKDVLVQTLLISLGSKDDGFYKSTRYTTWTFMIGYGTPPEEQLSYLVILIISIGIGLPLFIILLSALYACVRNMSTRHPDTYLNR